MPSININASDRLLTVPEAAARLNTSPRFIRRIVDERRIKFIRVGRHIRIQESVLAGFLEAGTVDVVINPRRRIA